MPIAGEILAGLCKDEAYRAVQRGEFPVPVVKCGRRMVVPVAPILELLGIKPDAKRLILRRRELPKLPTQPDSWAHVTKNRQPPGR